MYQKILSSKTQKFSKTPLYFCFSGFFIFFFKQSKYILVLKESAGSLFFKNVGFMGFYRIKKNCSGKTRVMSEEKKTLPPSPRTVKLQ